MIEAQRSVAKYTRKYIDSYPSNLYLQTSPNDYLIGSNSPSFRKSRRKQMQHLLEGELEGTEYAKALIAEHIVCLALQPQLRDTGFELILAPQSLEHGNGQKGVDILLLDEDSTVYLGIDVKLGANKSPYDRDGFGWSKNLQSPYMYLWLGTWSSDTYEGDEVNIKDWLDRFLVPSLSSAQQIPHLNKLRSYLIGRFDRSLSAICERLDFTNTYPHSFTPWYEESQTREIALSKLQVVHNLFH